MFFGGLPPEKEPSTELGKSLKKQLYIYLVVFLIAAVIQVFLGIAGLMELLLAIFLYCGARTINFCWLSSFVLFTLFSVFSLVVALGTEIQQGIILQKKMILPNVIIVVCLGVYIYGYRVCFLAYREFKAIGGQGGVQMFGGGARRAFGGAGGVSGGAYARPGDSSPNASMRADSTSSGGGGGFTAFQGSGVRIGGG